VLPAIAVRTANLIIKFLSFNAYSFNTFWPHSAEPADAKQMLCLAMRDPGYSSSYCKAGPKAWYLSL